MCHGLYVFVCVLIHPYILCASICLAMFSVINRINKLYNSGDKQIRNTRTTDETQVQLNRLKNRPQTLKVWGSSQLVNKIKLKQ